MTDTSSNTEQSGAAWSITDGWLDNAPRIPSPNCDGRPADIVVDLLVIHAISLPDGDFGTDYIDELFSNCLDLTGHPSFADLEGLRVSAHLLIRRDGGITQYVPFDRRAWHAGVSSWCGRGGCNDYSIGIELEGANAIAYTDRQYQVLATVTAMLQQVFVGIGDDRIVGHCDIAPDRKTDPGPAFDWERYRQVLQLIRERAVS